MLEVAVDILQGKIFFILNAVPRWISCTVSALTDPHLLLQT
jgi:hypothetical protein